MNIVLFDTQPGREKLFPLTFTRAIANIRMGILTGVERWEKISRTKVQVLTEEYLQPSQQTITPSIADEYLLIDATLLPQTELYTSILSLNEGEAIADEIGFIAGRVKLDQQPVYADDFRNYFTNVVGVATAKRIELPCRIFQWNDEVLRYDFDTIIKGRTSAKSNDTVQIINPSAVFIEEGANISNSILNATAGPIYIGKNSTVMEGCLIRGPFALCEGASLKMGTKIYGATTLGPCCVGGGEIKNAVMMGYSNKAHDGYLGDSVVGEWCNLGAGTSNSNVKNTGSEVKTWNYYEQQFITAGPKAGLIMGDYSRTSINTSINTGTVVGVCCNIFDEGLTPKLIPNFAWGTKELSRYEFDKCLKDIENWKGMKNKKFTPEDRAVLKYVFDNYND